jgi:predicted nucleic acid-binding Zn ribbon protein
MTCSLAHYLTGVNARVSDAADWIDHMVCKLSDFPPADFCCQDSCRRQQRRHRRVFRAIYALITVGLVVLLAARFGMLCPAPVRRFWSRWVVYGRTAEREKLLPLKTDSSLSSDDSDEEPEAGTAATKAADSGSEGENLSYGSVGNVEVL